MNAKDLVDKVLRGAMTLAEVEQAVADAAPQYRRPTPAAATLDDYIEWEERSRGLAQELSDINYAALKMPDSALSEAMTIAQVTKLMSSLVPNTSVPAQSDFLLGRLYFNEGKYFDASDLLADAASGYRSFGDPVIEVYALIMRADALLKINDREGALRAAEYALERATSNELEGLTASALRVKGAVLTDLGRGAEALECLRLALATRASLSKREVGEQSVAAPPIFLDSLGKAARRFGQYEEAVAAFLEFVESERQAGRLGLQALAVSEVGYTYLRMGEEARGFNYLEQAAGIAEAAGDTANALRWRTQAERWRGEQLADEQVTGLEAREIQSEEDAYRCSLLAEGLALQGKHEEALMAARAVLSWSQSEGDRELELTSRSIIGKVLSDQGRLEEAIEEARRAILVADSIDNDSSMLLMRGNLANCLIRMGRNNEAAAVLMDGVARSQALIAQTEGAEFRQGIMAGASNLYEQLAHLCSHFEQHDHLLLVTEQARARNVTGWMEVEMRLEDAAERATPGAVERLRELREVEVELEVRHFEGKLDARSVKDLQARRRHCRDALAALMSELNLPPLPWERVGMGFDSLDELIEDTVSDDSAVLSLFSASEGVCPVLVYRRDGRTLKAGKFISWDREERVNSLADWSQHLATSSGVRSFSAAHGSQSQSAAALGFEVLFEDFDRAASDFQSRLLAGLAQLVAQSGSRRLAVIPHRELAAIPFNSLLDACPNLHSLTVAPSLHALSLCQRRRRPLAGEVMLIGNPWGDLKTEAEFEIVREWCRGRVVMEPETLAELKRRAPSTTLMHAATHGAFFPQKPYYSGLIISQETDYRGPLVQYIMRDASLSEEPQPDGALLLTVAQIMAQCSLKSCRLAMLSACESGVARHHAGGEMMGLPASLLIAGAKSVIASLWPVHDEATSLLMRKFYQLWRGDEDEERGPAAALARARTWLKELGRDEVESLLGPGAQLPKGRRPFSHPVFSDAFQCFGGW